MNRLVWVFIFTSILSTFTVLKSNASEDAFNISEFYGQTDASQRMLLKMGENEEPVPVVILTIVAVHYRLMQIFDDDVCVTVANPIVSFTASYTCRSGAEMKVNFNCTKSGCYMQGRHSQKGKWKNVYQPSINHKLSLEKILEFAGTESSAEQKDSSRQDIQKTQPKVGGVSKLDKAKSTCAEIGFTAGTEDYGKCVLKMMDN
jgi:hypothetical protein